MFDELTQTYQMDLGCVHIDTSMSLGTRIRVPVNTSSRVFQRQPFTLTQVLYLVRVTCEFHSYEQFLDRSCFYPTHMM